MPMLNDAELRMVVEVVAELAKYRGTAFDKTRKGAAFARAALIDPAFKARLVEIHRRLEARRNWGPLRRMLAPRLRDIERDAETVLSGWKQGSSVATYRCVMVGVDDKVESVSEITALTQWGALRRVRSLFRAAAPRRVSLELWRDDKLIARIRPEEPKTRRRSF